MFVVLERCGIVRSAGYGVCPNFPVAEMLSAERVAMATLAMTGTALSGHPHLFEKIFDQGLLSSHQFSDFSSFVDQHRSHSAVTNERIPILGCGPTDSVLLKEESLRSLSSYVDLATVLHDEDQTCLVAHLTHADMAAQATE
jgi:hypothetical protein